MIEEPIRWGVLGCAGIAVKQVIPALQQAEGAQLVAVASRSLGKAQRTANQFGIGAAYGAYEELLDDEAVEAVYIPLPNHLHKPWSIAALRAGKHVLCEKPIALDADEAREMQSVAEASDRLLLEAFMYRFAPLVQKALEITRSGTLGELRAIHSVFNFHLTGDPSNVRLQPDTGGGALYDAGCYCINVQRMLAGREPLSASAQITWSPEHGVDVAGVGILDFGEGLRGTFFTGFNALWDSTFRVSGSRGRLEAPLGFLGREAEAILMLNTDQPPAGAVTAPLKPSAVKRAWAERIELEPVNPYVLQADDFWAALRGRCAPQFGWEPLDANMRVIDACFASDRLDGKPVPV